LTHEINNLKNKIKHITMKKQLSIITLSLALAASLTGFSQDSRRVHYCNSDEMMEDHFRSNPEDRKNFEASQAKFQQEFMANREARANANGKIAATEYTVPVVFHILHQGGPENISDQTIINAVQWINGDYAKTHGDASLTAAPFSSLYIASDIKLMLAHKDPNGNCTNGIIHHVDAKTNWNQGTAQSQDSYWSYTWDPTKYLNVYIVAQIIPQGTVTGGGIIVGYTYRPGTFPTQNPHDAIVYRYDFLSGSDARSLSHECGHWFSLQHTWGSTNNPGVSCGDDGIPDTPQTKGQFSSCPTSLSGNPCNGGGTDNVQNIMNYASCPINFTTDQTTAMRTALASGTSGRSNVISGANLIATDVNGTGICAPVADFLSSNNNYTICSGGTLNMKSTSYNGTISAYAWSATNNASVTLPTNSLTNVIFPSVGQSIVTLTVTNGQGSSTVSKTVTVLDGSMGVPSDYYEDFEGGGTPNNWTITNPNAGSVTWQQTSNGASHGGNSFFIEGSIDPAGHYDYLQMPTIDPLDYPNDTIFTFKYAYARYSTSNNDKFEVQASTDCGGTWSTVIGLAAGTMASGSGGVSNVPYIPAAGDWKKVDVYNHPNWFNYTGYKSVMVRFMFQEDPGGVGFGNRFYLDEIMWSSVHDVGINELTKSVRLQLYPNPTNSESTLKFRLDDAASVNVEVVDVLGRKALPDYQSTLTPGEHSVVINKGNTLSKGIYFINMSLNGAKMSKKLIIQ
jgi:hypothetical protein